MEKDNVYVIWGWTAENGVDGVEKGDSCGQSGREQDAGVRGAWRLVPNNERVEMA